MKDLRCAVIGLGRIGWQFHIPQIRMHDGFTLAAVVDPVEERLQEAKENFGVTALYHAYTELPPDQIDLAVITSPTRFHCEQAIYFLEHGVDVFCDKPVALSLAEAKKMKQAAEKNHRKIMVYQPHRLTCEALTAQAIMKSGKLGKLFMITRCADGFSRRNDWQAITANGGGMLFNYGAHYIDQMLYLGHDTCDHVKCELRKIVSRGDAEDVVKALITGKSGLLYDLNINQAAAMPFPGLALYGTMGTAIQQPDRNWRLRYCENMPDLKMQNGLAAEGRRYADEELDWKEETVPAVPERYDDFYRMVHKYFAENEAPFVPFGETLEVMRVIELCRKNAAEREQN